MTDLTPFLNKQPPNAKPTGQLASPRYNPHIKNFENSFRAPSAPNRFVPPRVRFPKFPVGVKLPLVGNLLVNLVVEHLLNPPPVADGTIPAHLRVPEPPQETQLAQAPFKGGQLNGVRYRIVIDMHRRNHPNPPGFQAIQNQTDRLDFVVWGPVTRIWGELYDSSPLNYTLENRIHIECRGFFLRETGNVRNQENTVPRDVGIYTTGYGSSDERNPPELSITIVSLGRYDNLPDDSGYPPGYTPPTYSPPGIYLGGPTYINYGSPAPPSPLPPTSPSPVTKAPSPLPNGGTNPTPIGQPNPTPQGTPEPPPQPNPNTGPTPTPTNVPPAVLRGPWSNPAPTPTSKPGYNPGFTPKFTPNPIQPHPGFSPNPIQVKPATPITPLPTTGSQPITTNNPTRTPTPEPVKPKTPETPETPIINPTDIKSTWDEVIKVGTGMVIIKQIVDGIAANTVPEAITTAAAAGTCRTLQPGGCMSGIAGNAQSAAQNAANNATKLDGINAGLNAANLSQITTINNKLGPQIIGGLSGAFGRLDSFLGISRAMNVLNTIVLLHNAFMLSSALKDTLIAMVGTVGNATGLLKSPEGNAVDLNTVFNQGVENFVKSIIGTANYDVLTSTMNKANRIYQASANMLSAVQGMMNGVQAIVEVTGERTGKIGNALRKFGVVGENAYNWMSENLNTRTGWFDKLEGKITQATETVSNIDTVASSVVSIKDSVAQLKTEKEAFTKALDTITPNAPPDNTPVKTASDTSKTNSQSPAITESDTRKPES